MTYKTFGRFTQGLWVLVALPPMLGPWLVYSYGVDVPFWDEWTIASLLQAIDDGRLTVAKLFAQHNEHRMLVPRAAQLLAALAAGWDTRVGMWLTQGLLFAMLGGCIVLWRRATPQPSTPWSLLTLALVSLAVFSPAQHQNLLWGYQVCFYIPAACLLASTIVASSMAIGLGVALAVIAFLCTLATFSLVPGLLTWPLAAAAVALLRGLPRRDTVLAWSGWAGCGGVVIAVYFLGYETPSGTPSVWSALGNPLALVSGVAECIGGLMGIGPQPVTLAMVTGTAITTAFLSLLAVVWRRRSDATLVANTTPWIVMGSFGLLTAIAIATGRVGYGHVALLESRYTALTVWTLVAVLMIAATLRDRLGTDNAARMWKAAAVATLAFSLIGFPHYLASIRRAYHERLQSLAIYTFAEAAPRAVPLLPPWLDWATFRQQLIQMEHSGWRKARPGRLTWVDTAELSEPCGFGAVEFMTAVGPLTMAGGWAYLPALGRPADAVLMTTGPSRVISVVQPPLIGRRDIGDRFGGDGALVTGWTLESRSAPHVETIEFWALDVKTLHAYPICQPTGLQH